MLKNLQQFQQLLGPELLITPMTERGFWEWNKRLIRNIGNHFLGGSAFSQGTPLRACGAHHTAGAELAHCGGAAVVTSDKPYLPLEDDQNPGCDFVGFT